MLDAPDTNSAIPESVTRHVKEWTFKVENPLSLVCIDWRTNREQTKFWWFTPGGTLWTFASVLSAFESMITIKGDRLERYITDEWRNKIYKILIDFIWNTNNICYHTDSDNCNSWWIWCWHLRRILIWENDYQLSNKSKIVIWKIRDTFQSILTPIVLEWGHKEDHVLITLWEEYSVVPNIVNNQGFVSTPGLVVAFKYKLAQILINNLPVELMQLLNINPSVLLNEMLKANERHLNETLKGLAPDLMAYGVEYLNDWNHIINHLWRVWDDSTELFPQKLYRVN